MEIETLVLVVEDVLAACNTLSIVLILFRRAGVPADRIHAMVAAELTGHHGREVMRQHVFGIIQIRIWLFPQWLVAKRIALGTPVSLPILLRIVGTRIIIERTFLRIVAQVTPRLRSTHVVFEQPAPRHQMLEFRSDA